MFEIQNDYSLHVLNIPKNRFDHPDILAGQGTMGLEILEQVPDLDAAIIPVGGGGLIAGVAKALKTMKPGVKIIVNISYLNISFVPSKLQNK